MTYHVQLCSSWVCCSGFVVVYPSSSRSTPLLNNNMFQPHIIRLIILIVLYVILHYIVLYNIPIVYYIIFYQLCCISCSPVFSLLLKLREDAEEDGTLSNSINVE
jgi:hypothetical protein